MQMCFCRYVCFFYLCGNHRDLHLLTHSVPTRRASDRKTENARPSTWVYVDVRGRDLASVVGDLQRAVAKQVRLSPGVSLAYSGQFEYLERSEEHTSELQSLMRSSYAVFCLKQNTQTDHNMSYDT